ncbi:Polypeptide-transport-associated domain protein FtsQ-type [Halothece sp. PCC 7418]|uniref:cell division protein FtsQ/DivIB n=1 Tax=Halothece sp. (strain PCC 7418) TaxID=65093 RepID=UPI0002A05FE9|nr:FtsQ-type POTRA domain-containing protein [Halothece sp. PCC 7418]AFZ44123.1 Polypeptide-transport-associated domain protein FtsQ-type [Halothece sp. PCC 7418]
MTSTSSAVDIKGRRLALKQQRQIKIIQSCWRFVLVSSLMGGLVWLSLLPKWTIRQPQQVGIQGNQYLSSETIKSLVEETTSQSILTLTPDQIKEILQNQAPIAHVSVARELYPPRVTIAVTERQPVAVTLPNPSAINPQEKGYIDAKGMWMSVESYRSSETFTPPQLKVIGYQPHDRLQWAKLYPQLQALPITVHTVNWQDPANLILETELGEVHLGGNLETLPQQFQVLAKLKNLPEQQPPDQMRYINLKDPDFILIELLSDEK